MEYKIIVVLCLMLADILTGFLQSIKNKTFKSGVMRTGLWHKVGYLLVIGLGLGLEYSQKYINLEPYITAKIPVLTPLLVYIAIMEIGSILENIKKINDSLTSVINKVFKGVNDD